jgi:putative ABC transport system ATP-binding protein
MDIQKHFDLILEKYELKNLYNKFLVTSILNTIVGESFYWLLLYLNDKLQTNNSMLYKYTGFLICLYAINIPLTKYTVSIKNELIKELKLANFKYFSEKIINIKKDTLLNFDLIEYYHALDHFNDYFQEYILSQQIKCEIPIRSISIIVIALNQDCPLLIGFFAVFYSIITVLNEHKLVKEAKITQELFDLENQVRNYMINSKQFVVNNEFNKRYIDENSTKVEELNQLLLDMTNDVDMKVNILLFLFILIIFYDKRETLTPVGFFYYFLMIYDIEYIADKLSEYYKNKINYSKMIERLRFLNSIQTKEEDVEHMTQQYNKDNIVINNITNDMPKINITSPLVINKGDHILVQGPSGSGKTSLLYVLKGMITCDQLVIEPNIKTINDSSYMVLSNNKSIFSGYLYDIISNYDYNPNVELIHMAIKLAKIDHKYNDNSYVDIDQLSGGERIRVTIARLIYNIKKDDKHDILLFDEVDENLNNVLAVEIATNLLNIFSDKIILYITHNEMVKKLFKKRIDVKDGVISKITNQ